MMKFPSRTVLPLAVMITASVLLACSKKEPVPEEETARLIQPVAKVELAGAAPAAAAEPRTGEQLAQAACGACHTAGVAGAPKTGDKAAWAPRIAQGYEALVKSVLNGKGAMPPKGGAADAQEIEIGRAVVYLANQAGASFKEPAAQ
jgi:cytochrome c5